MLWVVTGGRACSAETEAGRDDRAAGKAYRQRQKGMFSFCFIFVGG